MVRGTTGLAAASEISKLGDLAAEAGLHRVAMLAWRDLDDPEAGGSEVHASTVAALWAEAGIEVTMRTSFAAGQPQMSWRDGYRVIRKAGRYMVFPRAAFSEMMGWHGGRDGLVEIWNGMPFFSPLWARTPHITLLHHVHAEMWDMTLPPAARAARPDARVAHRAADLPAHPDRHAVELVEARAGRRPRLHATTWCTSCRRASTRGSRPGGEKSPTPLVVAVGRLVPVKRFELLIEALVALKPSHPDLEAVIVGEGYRRDQLETQIHEAGAERWIHLPGHLDRRRARRPVPAGLAARERLGPRGLGHDAHRGRRLRDARGRHPHRRSHRRGRRRAARDCSPTVADELRDAIDRVLVGPRRCASGSPPARSSTRAAVHLGRDGPRDPRGARRRGDAAAPPPVTAPRARRAVPSVD